MNFLEWLQQSLAYLPWLIFAALLSPMIVLAFFFRIYPTRKWLLALVPVLLGLILGFLISIPFGAEAGRRLSSQFAWVIVVLDSIFIVVVVGDLLTITRRSRLQIERNMTRVASLAKAHEVHLMLSNLGTRAWKLDVRDDQPDGLEADPPEQRLVLPALKRAVLTYRLKASKRGEYTFEKVYFRLHSQFGFWNRHVSKAIPGTLHVYPT